MAQSLTTPKENSEVFASQLMITLSYLFEMVERLKGISQLTRGNEI